MMTVIRWFKCLLDPGDTCSRFEGDDFTDWVRDQIEASRASQQELGEASGNPFEETIFPLHRSMKERPQ